MRNETTIRAGIAVLMALLLVSPAAAKKGESGEEDQLRRMLVRVTKYTLLVCAPVVIFLAVFQACTVSRADWMRASGRDRVIRSIRDQSFWGTSSGAARPSGSRGRGLFPVNSSAKETAKL